MKKFFPALMVVLLFATISSFAQKGLYFGIAVTGQSTWIINQNNYGLPDMDYKTTYGGGVNANLGFDFTNHIGLKMEVGYTKIGQKYTDNRADDSDTGKTAAFDRNIKLNYLAIPIMFKYRIGGPMLKFYFAVGPQFNMLLSAKQKYNKNGAPFLQDLDDTITRTKFKVGQDEIKERFSSSDIYARLDLGLDITVVKHLLIEAGIRFGYGLMDINSKDYRINDSSGKYHASHGVFGGISVGLNYHL